MPLKNHPECLKCGTTESSIWTNAENLGAICLDCVNEAKDEDKSEDENNDESTNKTEGKSSKKRMRITRSYKTRLNPFAIPKTVAPKGRGRRALFKKVPVKAPSAVASPVTSDHIFYKDQYFQLGDIVSLMDEDDKVYYAQLRGFLTDQYCEKSATITWLLPTQESPPTNECFDPATYIIGPEEEVPRKMSCMEFVMHAPSDYYKAPTTPYPIVHPPVEPGFVWSMLKPIQRLLGSR
ncbi:GATA zinc finger domain-containing protein 1 [Onthophagus taurus]|uniref:GATA zinc finger domain-containing protein 1 n=1 Tax=Onthophagus taurus TaxID=166361 RepID=UPI000C2070DB|nr:GATA zinc finger domain-containing protein 1 [Onthophagus taurus]